MIGDPLEMERTEKVITPHVVPRLDAGVQLAAQAARSLHQLNPTDAAIRQQKLLLDLEQLQVSAGLDQTLDVTATNAVTPSHTAVSDLNQVLLDAMRLGRVPAAVAAAQASANQRRRGRALIGQPKALSPRPSPSPTAASASPPPSP